MKALCKIILPILLFAVLFSGCSFWMDGSYVSVTPNHSKGGNQSEEIPLITTYRQVSEALAQMVEEGTQEGVLHFSNVTEEQAAYFMETAVSHVCRTNPIGAYAVNQINYEIGASMGKLAVAVEITYSHNRSEILRIKQAQDMEDVQRLIRVALDNCESGTVLRVNNYKNKDLIQYVEDYVMDYPQLCMEMPQVSVSYFPEFGQDRVIEILFTYQTSREALRTMQQSVSDVFKSALYYIDPMAANSEKYSQLYSFLMERYDYKMDASITPSYSLLRHGVGDSKAFATVYAAICRQVGLDCRVVSGTREGEALYWNVIHEEGVYYHLDLLECNRNGGFAVKTPEEMAGYVWDYSKYE